MRKCIRFLLVMGCCVLCLYSYVFANGEKHFILEDSGKIPIVYSGKYDEDMNTSKVTIRNFDVSKGMTLRFPEGIKVLSYKIEEAKGIGGIKQETEQLADKNLNFVHIENIKGVQGKNPEITLVFHIIASPDYSGDVLLSMDGIDEEIIIAEVKPPVIIQAEKVEKNMDDISTPETNIFIEEAYAGAMAEKSQIILETEEMIFSGECNLDVIEGSLDADCRIDYGKIIITVNQSSTDIPAKVKLSNIKVISYRRLVPGEYILYSIAGSAAQIDENNQLLAKGNGAMFETYSDKALTDAPVFDISKIKIEDCFVKILFRVHPAETKPVFNSLLMEIGSKTMYVDGIEKTIEAPAYISSSGNTMVPFRSFIDGLLSDTDKAKLTWQPEEKTLVLVYEVLVIALEEGSDRMTINGVEYNMGASSEIVNDRFFVPFRDICHAFDIKDENIFWDNEAQTITIK